MRHGTIGPKQAVHTQVDACASQVDCSQHYYDRVELVMHRMDMHACGMHTYVVTFLNYVSNACHFR